MAAQANTDFQNYYEVLQLSQKADQDTIDRVYRLLVKRYHPDNQETGDPHKFAEVVEAHRVLSDPEARAAYDIHYDQTRNAILGILDKESNDDGFDADLRTFETILSLLYIARRREPNRGGLGTVQMEHMLDRPAEFLEFHLGTCAKKAGSNAWITA